MSGPVTFRDSGNFLLDRVPPAEFGHLEPFLQRVDLGLRQVVHQFEAEVTHLYFPTTALLSLLTVLQEDDPVEAATTGREGFVGVTVPLGMGTSPHRVICQMSGESYRVPVGPFFEAMGKGPVLTRVVHSFIAYLFRVACQSNACNSLHVVESRATRWLLIMHDQAGRDEFPMTQEFLAFMLGVRRQTVTVIAGTLQSAGLIRYHRGAITVVDRQGLESVACECYATMNAYYKQVGLEPPRQGRG